MSYRLVICVDVDASSLEEAYGKVYEAMGKITGVGTGLDWSSDDEWYDPEGNAGLSMDLDNARWEFLKKRALP